MVGTFGELLERLSVGAASGLGRLMGISKDFFTARGFGKFIIRVFDLWFMYDIVSGIFGDKKDGSKDADVAALMTAIMNPYTVSILAQGSKLPVSDATLLLNRLGGMLISYQGSKRLEGLVCLSLSDYVGKTRLVRSIYTPSQVAGTLDDLDKLMSANNQNSSTSEDLKNAVDSFKELYNEKEFSRVVDFTVFCLNDLVRAAVEGGMAITVAPPKPMEVSLVLGEWLLVVHLLLLQ